jgi:hypothetical protein
VVLVARLGREIMKINPEETKGAKIIPCFFFAPFVSSGFIPVLGFS